jgi:hypothetical protein
MRPTRTMTKREWTARPEMLWAGALGPGVFSVALSLALRTFALTLPASSMASGATVAVCFSG